MYDDTGFIVLSLMSLAVICASFSGLFWAAVQDGRDERAFRRRQRRRR